MSDHRAQTVPTTVPKAGTLRGKERIYMNAYRRPSLGAALAMAALFSSCKSTVVKTSAPSGGAAQAPAPSGAGSWQPRILTSTREADYLPDFSYAGYHFGEEPLPDLRPTLEVTDFGAKPDDDADDTAAIQKALAAAMKASGPVVLHFAKGTFIVKNILFLE